MAPFWILTNPRRPYIVVAPHDARYVAGFRSLNSAKAFDPHHDKGVGFKLVSQSDSLRELRRRGLVGVWFEPGHESKEHKVPFDKLDDRQASRG